MTCVSWVGPSKLLACAVGKQPVDASAFAVATPLQLPDITSHTLFFTVAAPASRRSRNATRAASPACVPAPAAPSSWAESRRAPPGDNEVACVDMIDRRAYLFAALSLVAFGCSKPPESNATTTVPSSTSATTTTVSTTTVASDTSLPSAPSSTTVAKANPMPTDSPRDEGSGECGSRTEDWCAAPAGDPCGAHKDVTTCRADKKCKGMKYTGESVVACNDDGTGFTSNCPTVGCISR